MPALTACCRLLWLLQVMLLKNLEQGGARQLVNGSRGVIVRFITRDEYGAQVGGWLGGWVAGRGEAQLRKRPACIG
jgi:hypothetical protein